MTLLVTLREGWMEVEFIFVLGDISTLSREAAGVYRDSCRHPPSADGWLRPPLDPNLATTVRPTAFLIEK